MTRKHWIILPLALAAIGAIPATAKTIYVTSYGAVCNGTANDHAAIQAAFNAAAKGDTIVFPAGTCAYNGTVGCSGISVLNNYASNTGDDSFATVGVRDIVNRSIIITNNISSDSKASGVTVEGSEYVVVENNQITRSAVAGIRVASSSAWQSSRVDEVTVRYNEVVDAVTSNLVHPAILVYTNYRNITNVHLTDNEITNPKTWMAFQVYGNGATLSSTQIQDNFVTEYVPRVTDCIFVGSGTVGLTISGNLIQTGSANPRTCN